MKSSRSLIEIIFVLMSICASQVYSQIDSLPTWMRGGRSGPIKQLTFINNGKLLVSHASDITTYEEGVVRVHQFPTGKLLQVVRFIGGCCAVSHSGEQLATEEYHSDYYWHDLHIWNLKQGVELRKFKAPSAVHQIVFSSDDKVIATCGGKGFVCLWDVNTGKLLNTFQGFKEDVWSVAFSLDDSLIIARGGYQHECGIKIWNARTGKLKSSLSTHDLDARSIALSPDGKVFALSESSDSITLLACDSEKVIRSFSTKGKFPQTLSYSPDGTMLVSGSDGFHDMHMGDDYENTLLILNTNDPASPRELVGHSSDIKSSVFTPDSKLLVCGLYNGSAPLWDARSGVLVRKDVNRTSRIIAADFSPDSKSVITIDADGVIYQWNAENGDSLSTSQFEGEIGPAAAIHTNRAMIAVSETYTGVINIKSATTGKPITSLSIAEALTESVADSSNELVADSSDDMEEAQSEEDVQPAIEIRNIAFSKRASFLLAATQEEISLVDTRTGNTLTSYKPEWQPSISLAFSSDEKQYAASLINARMVLVWDTNSKEPPLQLSITEHNYPHKMVFSNDGKYLAVAYNYGPMRIWDIAHRQIVKILEPEASSLAYSPDGNYLAASDRFGSVTIWNVKTYLSITKLCTSFKARFEMLRWSPDGERLLGLTKDGAIAVWITPKQSD